MNPDSVGPLVVITHGALTGRGVPLLRADVSSDALFAGTDDRLDELARELLTPWEQTRLQDFKLPKRRREWVGGRIAAKALVARHLADATDWAQIEIKPDDKGAPRVRFLPSTPELPEPPALSISHSRDRIVAALLPATAGARVGIDIEKVAPRKPAFVERVLTAVEKTQLPADPDTRDEAVSLRWCVKEATSKSLGLGLPEVVPWEVEVAALRPDGCADINLLDRALDRFRNLAGRQVAAHAMLDGNFAYAEVVLELEL